MASWTNGLLSVGGETVGEIVPVTTGIFHNHPIGDNTDAFFIDYEDVPFSDYPINIETRASQETDKLLAKFPIRHQGVVTNYLGIRYSYRKGVNAQSRLYLTISADVGIMDDSDNFTMMNGTGECGLSIGGTSLYTFKATIHLCVGTQNNRTVFGLAVQNHEYAISNDYEARCVLTSRDYVQGLALSKDKSPEYGNKAMPKGGYNADATKRGTFDDSSDTITVSSKPTLSVGDSGFVHAYKVTTNILEQIGTALFPKIESQSFTGIPEAIDYLTMVMFFNKRTDYILDLLILPISVPANTLSRIKVGGSELVVNQQGSIVYCQAPAVDDYYVDFDCGNLSIEEYWANFLDFTGTRFKLFLPAIGYVDLQNEFINGGEINVKYRFNIVDGSFMCFVTSTSGQSNLEQSLIAQYSGVWCMHIPITGQDYTQKISGLISSVGQIAAGGVLGGGGGAFLGAVNSLANTAMQKPSMTHANGYNASSSFLTHRKPYIIIERQVSQFSEIYPSENGLPCYVAMQLSQVSGFTIIENPVLNIDCNDNEYNELVALMKNGIIL